MRVRFVLVLVVLLALVPAAAQPATDLSQQYTYAGDEGQVSLRYPAGWEIEDRVEDGFLYLLLSSSSEAAGRHVRFEGLKPGQVHLDLLIDLDIAFDISGVSFAVGELSQADLYAILADMLAEIYEPEDISTLGEITTSIIDDRPAAQVIIDHGELGRTEYAIRIREQRGRLFTVVLALSAAPDELERWRSTALDVLETLVISDFGDGPSADISAASALALALTETASFGPNSFDPNSFGPYTVRYPAQWVPGPGWSETLYLATSLPVANRAFGERFDPGEVQMYLEIATLADLGQMAQTTFSKSDGPLDLLEAIVDFALTLVAMGGASFEATDMVAIEFNGAQAARARISGQGFEGMVWIVQYEPEWFLLGQVLTAPAELAQWQATAEAMLASVALDGRPLIAD